MRSHKIVVVLALCTLTITGCKKKKKVQTLPPAPVIAPSTATAPPVQQPQQQSAQPATTAQTPPSQASTMKPAKPKAKHVVKHQPAPKTTPPATTTTAKNTAPPRITVEPGSLPNSDGTIAANIPHSQATDERRSTEQLLKSTEDNLRGITRTLTDEEQATVATIRSFMSQSQAATKEGDLVRAHNLALKAHLLSDDLAKR
jgi:histidine triad (HIT) family protein